MFTVRVTRDDQNTDQEFEYAAHAWQEFGWKVQSLGLEMSIMSGTDAWPITHARMAYMIDRPGVEVEYAKVTIA